MGTGFLRLPSIDRRRGCRRHVLCGRRCCDARARLVRRRLLFAIVVACRAARCVGRRRVVASAALLLLLLLLLLLHVSDACACACYCSVRATDPLTRQARAGADDDAHERRFFPLAAWRRVASAWRWSPRCVVCERQAARHRAATRDVRGGGRGDTRCRRPARSRARMRDASATGVAADFASCVFVCAACSGALN